MRRRSMRPRSHASQRSSCGGSSARAKSESCAPQRPLHIDVKTPRRSSPKHQIFASVLCFIQNTGLRIPVLSYAEEMRTLLLLLTATICCTACGGDDPPPSCQQAVSHYYAAGCALFMTNGQQFAELDVIADCKGLLANSPSSACDDALADLRICFNSVKTPATSNADCDCSAEQDAILTCD
jgi:hypothetical protein